jgi:hypothetical protein
MASRKPMKAEKWEQLRAKGIMAESAKPRATDWVPRYKEGNDSKYGMYMYSEYLGRLRMPDILEFYGRAIID